MNLDGYLPQPHFQQLINHEFVIMHANDVSRMTAVVNHTARSTNIYIYGLRLIEM